MTPEPLVDFTRRAEPSEIAEWMDEPCTYDDFRACLVDLRQCNTLTLAARPTLRFLADVVATHPANTRLRILDVGCGGGDMLRRIEHWARAHGYPVALTGIDLNPYAARAAAEFTPAGSTIQWLTGDAYAYTEPVDVVLSSLFTHHLETPEVIRFLAWSQAAALRGWFINDLCREPLPFSLFKLLAGALRWHRFVRHDGPVSFRRSFQEQDWERMLSAAGIPAATLQRWTPGRLCVGRTR